MKQWRESFLVKNGRIVNNDYDRDFHIFEDGKIVVLKIALPGININSLQVRSDHQILKIKVRVDNQYVQLYQAYGLILSGELPFDILKGVLVSSYDKGILRLELVKSSHEDKYD